MLSAEIKRRIDAARDILVGKLPLPTDQVELITLTLIYKFMDDLDEQSVNLGGKRSFFVKDLEPYRWRSLLSQKISGADRVKMFADGLEALGDAKAAKHLPETFRDVFRDSILKFRDGQTLSMFMKEIDGFTYSHSEELGNAFEYLLQTMQVQGENGQFRTPRHIIDFIVEILEPKLEETILDPACGTGGFLVSAYKYILNKYTSEGSSVLGDQLSPARREKLTSNLSGYDITPLMVKLSKVNMYLHGFSNPQIHEYDTLSNEARWGEKANLILANPPFMTPKGGVNPHTKFRITAKKTEVLFTDYIAEHLNASGRGGIIVPNGILATVQKAYVKLRQFLIEESLVAVISLPAGVFKPYSGVKTSILLLDKTFARSCKEVLLVKITADGFDLGDKRTPVDANDLPVAESIIKRWLARSLRDEKSPLKWKSVERDVFLKHRTSSLQAEHYLGEKEEIKEIDVTRISDICEKCTQTEPSILGGKTFQYIDIESVDNKSFCITNPKTVLVEKAPSRARKLVQARDVLFSTVRPYLKNIAMVPQALDGAIASTGFAVLRAKESKVLPEYLFISISDNRFIEAANELTTGASYPAITENQLFDLEIPLPSIKEQKKIVDEVISFKKIIEGAQTILGNYKPKIPIEAEWPTKTLGEICLDFQNGVNFAKEQVGRGTPFVNIKDLFSSGYIQESGLERVKISEKEILKKTLKKDDLLFVRSSVKEEGVGFPSLMPACSENIVFCGFIIKCSPDKSVVHPKYLLFILRTEEFRKRVIELSSRANITNISQDNLKSLQIPLPSLLIQGKIVKEIEDEQAMVNKAYELIGTFEKKIQGVMDRVWGNGNGT